MASYTEGTQAPVHLGAHTWQVTGTQQIPVDELGVREDMGHCRGTGPHHKWVDGNTRSSEWTVPPQVCWEG